MQYTEIYGLKFTIGTKAESKFNNLHQICKIDLSGNNSGSAHC